MQPGVKRKEKSIRLLFVEDDKVDQMAFARMVKNKRLNYAYTTAGSKAEAIRVMAGASFDIAIADYMLGDGTVFDLFDFFKGMPVIVTTGAGNEEVAVEAMKMGAYDYLIKDAEGRYLKTLPLTVEIAVKRSLIEKQLQEYQENLEFLVEKRTKQLDIETRKLEEMNTALRVILNQRKEDRGRIEETILGNLKELVFPYLASFKKIERNPQKRVYIDIIESNLNSIIEPFATRLSSKFINLTPMEIKVADMIKHGKNTKEIAELFSVSRKTVETHRSIIRKKLGLTHTKANLRTYLLSLP
ncbi:MAG: LuxR C-terminal-related transcriptional regulator [Deltaproteobacteria bacterium]|nr:LuxR C-terminal-related transcriptional regulator [Deltaproteobacteria bacterium]